MSDCVSNEFRAEGAGGLHRVITFFKTRAKRRSDLRQLRQINNLSPQILKDIGVRREDVLWAANLPVELDAVKALKKETGHR